MQVTVTGKLIDIDKENWEFEGKKGTRYWITIKDQDKKLVQVKVDENSFPSYQEYLGQDIEIKCNIYIKGTYSLKAE